MVCLPPVEYHICDGTPLMFMNFRVTQKVYWLKFSQKTTEKYSKIIMSTVSLSQNWLIGFWFETEFQKSGGSSKKNNHKNGNNF